MDEWEMRRRRLPEESDRLTSSVGTLVIECGSTSRWTEPVRSLLMSLSAPQHLRVETITGITIVSIVDNDLLAEEIIQEVGEQLFRLVEEQGQNKLVLSFRDVRYMSSAMVGQLVKL